jgi:RNA polymerase sigma-70 factor (ECF subfamily)
MVSDEVLMLQFQSGSRECFEDLHARYRNPLYAFFRRRLPSKEAAEDLSQETWLAVLRGAVRYEPRALFRTYLYGIAVKLAAGEWRRSARRTATAISDDQVSNPAVPDSDHWVREALSKLDANEREILMLREYEQLSYVEIAELLHIPVNTVRSRLFRARVALKYLLEPKPDAIRLEGRL